MNGYSYSELQSMQQRAMERVREMQKNSDLALKTAKADLEQPAPLRQNGYNAFAQPRTTKVTNMPPNFPDTGMFSPPAPVPAPKEHEKSAVPQSELLNSIISEPDRAMLLGLLLLLKSEGADEELMLALLYIML